MRLDTISTPASERILIVKACIRHAAGINHDSEAECKMVEYSHGYRKNDFYSANTYRLVFGSHGAESDRTFQGAINFSGITQANLKLTFGVNATFRVTAVQLGVTSISSTGRLTQKID